MSLSTHELAKRIGVTYRQLNYWSKLGYLIPDGNVSGIGNQQWFSGWQIAKATLMADLVQAGVSAHKANAMASGERVAISALDRALTACKVRLLDGDSVVSGGT